MNIMTWNSQGNKPVTIVSLLAQEVDVLCVQEAGNPYGLNQNTHSPTGDDIFQYDAFFNIQGRFIYWYNRLAGDARCSLLICLSNEFINGRQYQYDAVQMNDLNQQPTNDRIMLVVMFAAFAISSVHCPPNRADGRRTRDGFAELMRDEFAMTDWQMVGDFNCPPDNSPQGTKIISSAPIPTHGDSVLDYMVRRNDNADFARLVLTDTGSDHNAVLFTRI
jgi:hypothetical protein